MESSRNVGIGKPDAARLAETVHEQQCRPAGASPLDWLDEPPREQLSDARRREILSLGFPDDGYDYLKHMRRGHEEDASESRATEVEQSSSGAQSVSVTPRTIVITFLKASESSRSRLQGLRSTSLHPPSKSLRRTTVRSTPVA